jgi:hypothetical protein
MALPPTKHHQVLTKLVKKWKIPSKKKKKKGDAFIKIKCLVIYYIRLERRS